MIPDLDIDGTTEEHLPQGCKDVGEGYLLLRAREEEARPLQDCEGSALCDFLLRADFAYRREHLFPICYSL